MTIHRTIGPIRIRATRFRCWADLATELALTGDELAHRCVFSDLSLGAWRGHWIGRELYAQLGLSFPGDQQPRIQMHVGRETGGGYFGELTDNEARGDFNVLLAYRTATDILAGMRRTERRWIVVLAPLGTTPWGADNLALLRFLAQGCHDAGCELVLAFTARAESPARDLELQWSAAATGDEPPPPVAAFVGLGVVPGVIPAVLVDGSPPCDRVALPDGSVVLSPLARGEPPGSVRACLAQLAGERLSTEHEWLNGYALVRDERELEPNDLEASVLLSGAIDRLCEGGNDIALRLLAHAKRTARSVRVRAATETLTQHVLLRLREFEEASRGPLPADDLPPPLRLGLFQSKGWGLTMIGKAAEAEPLLERARSLANPEGSSRAYLYLLNITALNQLRLGRHDSALALEKTIEEALAAISPTDWHATYINSINQARLYKKASDLATSEAYYRKAFAIIDGLRSDSDLLYCGLCFAQLEAKKGNARAAVLGWLRAALHWLSSEIPEALAPRVVEAVTLGRRVGRDEDLVERVSAALREQLLAASAHADIDPAAAPAEPPVFAPAAPGVTIERAIGNDGWGLFLAATPTRRRFSSPEYLQLSREVWRYVRAVAGTDVPETCTVLVDNQLGSDVPQTLDELTASCVRHGVPTLVFAGRRVDVGDPTLKVRIAPGVATCRLDGDAPAIVYKRYRKPLALTPRQAGILQRVTDDSTVASVAANDPHDDVLSVLRALEADRVVRISI